MGGAKIYSHICLYCTELAQKMEVLILDETKLEYPHCSIAWNM